MKKIFKRALVMGGLLLSTTAHVQANNEFTDVLKGLVPASTGQMEEKTPYTPKEGAEGVAVAAKYLKQQPIDMKMVKKIAGKGAVFTLDTMDNAEDGAYIVLRQSDLASSEALRSLQSVLEKPTDVHVILDVQADSRGALSLHSIVQTKESDGTVSRKRILPFIKHLHLMNSANDITTIGQSFLFGDTYVENVTFTGFESVTHIADGFMAMCPILKSADLSSFEHLKQIDNFFMSEAKGLTQLVLPTTRFFNADLTKVGDHFLRGATSLTRVQEEALESVTNIGDYFMSESGLTRFNTGKFKKLQVLGAGFLAKCSGLSAVDLSGLKRISPEKITDAEAKEAEKRAENAKLSTLANYLKAWDVTTEADRLEQEAAASEGAALKQCAQVLAIVKGTVENGRARAAAKGYEGKVVLTSAEHNRILTARDHVRQVVASTGAHQEIAEKAASTADLQLRLTEGALAKSKAAKMHADFLRANVGLYRNLGVLHGCVKLNAHPGSIRGAGKLSTALRNQLHREYSRLTYDDDFGCC